MIITSEKYKDEMAKPIRNSTQIRITHFMLDSPMLETPVYMIQEEGVEVIYRSAENIVDSVDTPVTKNFAYMANNTMKMDGTQYALPDTAGSGGSDSWQNGWIPNFYSDNVFSEELNGYDYGDGGILQAFSKYTTPWSPSGIIMEFDNMLDVYPTKINIEIIKDTITVYDEILDNDSRIFSFKNDYTDIDTINITFLSLNKPKTYMRVIWFEFGVAKIYLNQDLMQKAFVYNKEADLMAGEISYANLSFNVKNYPVIYDGDTIVGDYINFKDYQPLTFEIGITKDDGDTEWLQVAKLYTFGKIIVNDNYFTITAKDPLSTYNSLMIKVWSMDGESYSWRNTIVAGYFFSTNTFLTRLITAMKFPKKMLDSINNTAVDIDLYYPPNQIMQLIANYNNCAVFVGNNTDITFKETTVANVEITDNGSVSYSDLNGLYYINDLPNALYANLQKDFMSMNGTLLIPPEDQTEKTIFYFQSDIIGDLNGEFSTNPLIEIIYSIPKDINILDITFDVIGHQYAVDFTVTYYDVNDSVLDEIIITDSYDDLYQESLQLYKVKKVTIEILKWSHPYRSPIVMKYNNGLMSGYYLQAKDMYKYPTKESFDQPSVITHKYYSYPLMDEWVDLGTVNFFAMSGGVRAEKYLDDFYVDYDYEIISGTAGTITLAKSWANYVYAYSDDTILPLTIKFLGKKRSSIANNASRQYSEGVVSYNLDNPYVTTEAKALEQIDWYYNLIDNGYKLNVKYRGDPSIDVVDYILVDTKTRTRVPVVVTKLKLEYNGGMSGELEMIKV